MFMGCDWNFFWYTSENIHALNPQGSLFNADIGNCLSSNLTTDWITVTTMLTDWAYWLHYWLGYHAYSYYPPRSSENVWKMIYQVICYSDIKKCLFTCIHYNLDCGVMMIHQLLTDIGKCLFLVQVVLRTDTDFFPVYISACFIHQFLSVVQLQSQCSPFSISDG